MPLFSYTCEKCHKNSEILVRGAEPPKCPHCGSDKLVKQASAFSPRMGASKAPAMPSACESCAGRGSCPRA